MKRHKGNNIKLTTEIKNYVKGFLENKRCVTSLEIRNKINKEFKIDISVRSINRFRQKNKLSLAWPPKKNCSWNKSRASELVIALSLQTGLIDTISEFIYRRAQNKRRTKQFRESVLFKKDY